MTLVINAKVVITAFLAAEEGPVPHKTFVIDLVADFVSDSDFDSDCDTDSDSDDDGDSVAFGDFGTVRFAPQRPDASAHRGDACQFGSHQS